jgi:hypothetical protein
MRLTGISQKVVSRWSRCLASSLVFLVPWLGLGAAPTVSLGWKLSPDPRALGYTVLYGTATGSYSQSIDVGNVSQTVVSGLAPGTTYYFAVFAYGAMSLTSPPSNEVAYQVPAASSAPAVTASKAAFRPGEAVPVSFSNASGSAHDWLGLFAAGAPNTSFLEWLYTDGSQTGTAGILNGVVTFASGLPNPGNYEARLFFNDSYVAQASVAFGVSSTVLAGVSGPRVASVKKLKSVGAPDGVALCIVKANDSVTVAITGPVDRRYLVETSPDLLHWSTLTQVELVRGKALLTDRPDAGGPKRRFYRAVPSAIP